jgi:peptidoglycan/LPS O-acetylase OafA/YrhL
MFALVAPRPPSEVFASGAWALLGLSNIQLVRSSQDYFSLDTQLNPFTHTWSLGVEEQFYFVYPALIALTAHSWVSRRDAVARSAVVVFILSILSLISFVILHQVKPAAAFYLMPARFWELGVGCLACLVPASRPVLGGNWVANCCAVGIIGCFFLPGDLPSVTTILVVVFTGVLIVTINQYGSILYSALSSHRMVFIGRISYSLYLWHWSVLVLGRWTFGDGPLMSFVLLGVTLIFAVLSFYFIEEPLRRADWSASKLKTIVVGGSVILPLFFLVSVYIPNYFRNHNHNLPSLFGIHSPDSGFKTFRSAQILFRGRA